MLMMIIIIIIAVVIKAASSFEMLISNHQSEWCHISQTVVLNYQIRDSYPSMRTGC
jgi:hypothetical protein